MMMSIWLNGDQSRRTRLDPGLSKGGFDIKRADTSLHSMANFLSDFQLLFPDLGTLNSRKYILVITI